MDCDTIPRAASWRDEGERDTCWWAGVDSAWEQEKTRIQCLDRLDNQKMLENGDDWAREQSAATITHLSA